MERYVYFIEAVGLGCIKIGIASNPHSRLKELQTGCPSELRLISVIKTDAASEWERELHARFGAALHRGEWFSDTADLRDFAEAWFQTDDEIAFLWRSNITSGVQVQRYAGESAHHFANRAVRIGVEIGSLVAA